MQINNYMTTEEKLSLVLSSLAEAAGYSRFRMSKFEEYSLYLENKNFLSSEHIITFNDSDGKLLALKPDVTLSIVKNLSENFDGVKKLYYNENVYRLDKTSKKYKEIGQLGVEAVGQIDEYTVFEVVTLALECLAKTDKNYLLDISNIGFVTAYLDSLDLSSADAEKVMACIGVKNVDGILRLADELRLDDTAGKTLKKLITANGDFEKTLSAAKELVVNDDMKKAVDSLCRLYDLLKKSGYKDKIRLDFSIINDITYYNDIVFRGYVEKAPRAVLSGGRYDKLAAKFNDNAMAIGFAVYLNEIGAYYGEMNKYDVDVVILYDKDVNVLELNNIVRRLNSDGLTVLTDNAVPEGVRYGKLYYFSGTLSEVKND